MMGKLNMVINHAFILKIKIVLIRVPGVAILTRDFTSPIFLRIHCDHYTFMFNQNMQISFKTLHSSNIAIINPAIIVLQRSI